jgi:excinuclease UvrABC nuclease subunit
MKKTFHKLNDKSFIVKDNIPELPGVYKIIAVDEEGDPIEINRVLDTDQSGTLYIGKADNLRKRLANMRRAFSESHKSTKHIAVRRYNSLKHFKAKFPVDRIIISIEVAQNDETAKQLETRHLALYEKLLGERPPLNRQ